jgi:energy-converting hydrogenase A subunit M
LISQEDILGSLSKFLDPQLKEIIEVFSTSSDMGKYFIEIPDSNYIDLTINDLASLVARSSNVYGRAARFAGIARAQYKLLEAQYKRVYKANRVGKNEAEREAAAITAADKEYMALMTVEAVVQLAESMESAARISSESARKLMDKVQSMQIATAREDKGYFSEKDFSTF